MFDWSSESEGKPLVIKDELELQQSKTADFVVFMRRDVDCASYS